MCDLMPGVSMGWKFFPVATSGIPRKVCGRTAAKCFEPKVSDVPYYDIICSMTSSVRIRQTVASMGWGIC